MSVIDSQSRFARSLASPWPRTVALSSVWATNVHRKLNCGDATFHHLQRSTGRFKSPDRGTRHGQTRHMDRRGPLATLISGNRAHLSLPFNTYLISPRTGRVMLEALLRCSIERRVEPPVVLVGQITAASSSNAAATQQCPCRRLIRLIETANVDR